MCANQCAVSGLRLPPLLTPPGLENTSGSLQSRRKSRPSWRFAYTLQLQFSQQMLFILHCLSGSCLASLTKILSSCPSPPQLLDFSSAKILKLRSPEMATSQTPTQAYWIKHSGPGNQPSQCNESFRASERQLGMRTSVQFPRILPATNPLPDSTAPSLLS